MARVLRIPRSDQRDDFILIHIANSGRDLNVTLTATEGESPYITKINESNLSELRAKNYQGSEEEWTQIIAYVLGQEDSSTKLPSWDGVESTASINGSGDDDKEIVITIRKRVESITQKLGAITLKQDDEELIAFFEWASLAAGKSGELENKVIDLTDRCRTAEDTVQKLKKQLEELTKAKIQHEHSLVTNFAQILNEKKLKIRNQQRLLASATVDPVKVAEIQAHATQSSTAKGDDNSTKRSADAMGEATDDSDDDFEKMDVDRKNHSDDLDDQDTDDERRMVSTPSDDGGNTTPDDDSDGPEESGPTVTASQPKDTPRRSSPKESTPPPRRELPFTRRKPAPQPETAPAQNDDGDATGGETDDDEL